MHGGAVSSLPPSLPSSLTAYLLHCACLASKQPQPLLHFKLHVCGTLHADRSVVTVDRHPCLVGVMVRDTTPPLVQALRDLA